MVRYSRKSMIYHERRTEPTGSMAESLLRPGRRRIRLTVAGDTPTTAATCSAV